MTEKILLNKNKSKVSTNNNNSLTVQLKGSKRILPCDPMEASVSEIDVYNKERKQCENIRLTVQVNPICSNVLFNNITEIVKNEGSEDALWLNHGKNCGEDLSNLVSSGKVFFKQKNDFCDNANGNSAAINAIRDTQLSSSANGYEYKCGIDIFNNHLLRSKTFKTVCPLTGSTDSNFNTIYDKMRNYNGEDVKDYKDENTASETRELFLHLYTNEDILSYKETVSNKLIESNGWFGFTNIGKLKVYDDRNNKNYDWFKVINNRKPCDFIDMYPNRELFFFDPKYNPYRQRVEKNWHYCITYPSSSTTDISFIKNFLNGTTGLKVMIFDDTIKHRNGTNAIKITSVSYHGLSKENTINIYKNEDCIIRNAKVIDVVDNYTFYVFAEGVKISQKWVELPENVEESFTANGISYSVSSDRKTLKNGGNTFYTINFKKANVDETAQDISFKRVIDNKETSYYVRIFSKLPNWKFAKQKPTELLLNNDKNFQKEYQKPINDFDSHIGKLAFSKNIYTDNIAEVVFTDDINISVLKDNLGRPISELYFTIIKNNAGYREWYGKGSSEIDVSNEIVEYSHCFGKVSCAFKLSKESIPNKDHKNLLMINNIDSVYDRNGLDMTYLNEGSRGDVDDDEIQYELYKTYSGDSSFYGDLCCYSETLCDEQSIQMVDFRFNTAQREINNSFKSYPFLNTITYDEIMSDVYDDNGFNCREYLFTNAGNRKEGYYYKPHYKIPIRTFDNNLTTMYPRFLTIKNISLTSNGVYTIQSMESHQLGKGDLLNILFKEPYINEIGSTSYNKHYYYGRVKTIYEGNTKIFDIELFKDSSLKEKANIDISNKRNIKIFVKTENTPSYATLMKDGSCRYVYRELHQNGFDDNTDVETYPFTNNSLYVNKSIMLFLKRQNPNGETDLRSKTYPYDITRNEISFEKENKYYHEQEIEC